MMSWGNAASCHSGLPTNFAFFKQLLNKFFYKFDNPEINCLKVYPASFKNNENREGF